MDDVVKEKKWLLEKLKVLRESNEKYFFKNINTVPEVLSSDIFDSIRDGTHDTPKKQSKGFKLLTSKNISNNRLSKETDYFISKEDYDFVNQRSKVDKNDILFGMIGTVGQVCRVINEPDYAIKNIGLFKTRDKTLSVFAYYYFKSTFFNKIC